MNNVGKKGRKGVGEGKPVLVEAQYEIPFVAGDVNKHPKSVFLRVTHQYEVTYNEVDTLGIAHLREVVSNTF